MYLKVDKRMQSLGLTSCYAVQMFKLLFIVTNSSCGKSPGWKPGKSAQKKIRTKKF